MIAGAVGSTGAGVLHEPMPLLLRADARALPLPDASVDLIVTSPPFWQLRDYRDVDGSLAGQLGAEASPREYIEALLTCTTEWMRVLKPTGSLWVNLGDGYAANSDGCRRGERWSHQQPAGRARSTTRNKSLHLIPERYRIACSDELGLIAREVVVWSKANGLPESVTDRVRRSHEDWVHLVDQRHYYAAVDEIREPHTMRPQRRPAGRREDLTPRRPGQVRQSWSTAAREHVEVDGHPLGKLPGSVWEVPTQPLLVPDAVVHARCCAGNPHTDCTDGIDHFAAFPMAWPRALITGWCPREVCTSCEQGRRPVTAYTGDRGREPGGGHSYTAMRAPGQKDTHLADAALRPRRITGYRCACPDTTAPARPGVVLDPFGGTGTTALVAAMLGRTGISADLSHAYTATLATWRARDPRERARAAGAPPQAVSAIPRQVPGQLDLLDGATS